MQQRCGAVGLLLPVQYRAIMLQRSHRSRGRHGHHDVPGQGVGGHIPKAILGAHYLPQRGRVRGRVRVRVRTIF